MVRIACAAHDAWPETIAWVALIFALAVCFVAWRATGGKF